MTNLLEALKKANKTAREKMAAKHGYISYEAAVKALGALLEGGSEAIKKGKKKKDTIIGELKTVHNVHILDVSTSMWSKIVNACKGINQENADLRKETEVKYTNTFFVFSSGPSHVKNRYYMQPVDCTPEVNEGCTGSTALYDAIGEVITRIRVNKKYDEKVLLKIFTDGEENSSRTWNATSIRNLIAEVENEGFTVTFVGTERDVRNVVDNLHVDFSNTLSHDNTAEGVLNAFTQTRGSTMSYAANVSRGLDVKKGFYKKFQKTN